jgi:hypothetical protein
MKQLKAQKPQASQTPGAVRLEVEVVAMLKSDSQVSIEWRNTH